jgi:hypothetical protein
MSNTTPEPTKDPKQGTDGHGKPTSQPTTTTGTGSK